MKTPILIINYKTYPQGLGRKAVELAEIADQVAKERGVAIAVCPQAVDLRMVRGVTNSVYVLAQHTDPYTSGAHTGSITISALLDCKVHGTLLNHSEKKIKLEELAEVIRLCKENGLVTVCCASNPEEAREVAKYSPDFIAIEPPELIGTGIAVSQAKPEVLTQTIDEVRKISQEIKLLCGAGITKGEDVERALEVGMEGVLVASGIVKASNPRKVIEELSIPLSRKS